MGRPLLYLNLMLQTQVEHQDIELQGRDVVLLRELFESCLMTLKHIGALYFHGSQEAAKKRLQKLKRAGLVGERARRPYEPSILFLTVTGFNLLSEKGALSDYPSLTPASFEKRAQVSDLTIKHELDILEVKTVLMLAIREKPNSRLIEFSTWPALFQFEAAPGQYEPKRPVRPDGFIRIEERQADGTSDQLTFFLELDRSTEVLERLAAQACCYREYFRTGGLGKRLRVSKRVPFRVLIVLQNPERRNNVADSLLRLNPPILQQVWLATLPDLRANPLRPIWMRPVDYREATKNTAFDPDRPLSCRHCFGRFLR